MVIIVKDDWICKKGNFFERMRREKKMSVTRGHGGGGGNDSDGDDDPYELPEIPEYDPRMQYVEDKDYEEEDEDEDVEMSYAPPSAGTFSPSAFLAAAGRGGGGGGGGGGLIPPPPVHLPSPVHIPSPMSQSSPVQFPSPGNIPLQIISTPHPARIPSPLNLIQSSIASPYAAASAAAVDPPPPPTPTPPDPAEIAERRKEHRRLQYRERAIAAAAKSQDPEKRKAAELQAMRMDISLRYWPLVRRFAHPNQKSPPHDWDVRPEQVLSGVDADTRIVELLRDGYYITGSNIQYVCEQKMFYQIDKAYARRVTDIPRNGYDVKEGDTMICDAIILTHPTIRVRRGGAPQRDTLVIFRRVDRPSVNNAKYSKQSSGETIYTVQYTQAIFAGLCIRAINNNFVETNPTPVFRMVARAMRGSVAETLKDHTPEVRSITEPTYRQYVRDAVEVCDRVSRDKLDHTASDIEAYARIYLRAGLVDACIYDQMAYWMPRITLSTIRSVRESEIIHFLKAVSYGSEYAAFIVSNLHRERYSKDTRMTNLHELHGSNVPDPRTKARDNNIDFERLRGGWDVTRRLEHAWVGSVINDGYLGLDASSRDIKQSTAFIIN